MSNSCHGMNEKHPWSGKSHHRADPFPHIGFITVYLAVRAKSLSLHKGALVASHSGICFQFGAFRTKVCFSKSGCFAYCFMLFPAVEQDHIKDHFLFPVPFVLQMCGFISIVLYLICIQHAFSF